MKEHDNGGRLNTGMELPLVESFYTVQGEGYNTGRAAYFIRLAGCGVRCSWCDAKQTWDLSRYPAVKVEDIVAKVLETPAKYVVVTEANRSGTILLHCAKALRYMG